MKPGSLASMKEPVARIKGRELGRNSDQRCAHFSGSVDECARDGQPKNGSRQASQ
jgi:hypothetical protein